jgi:nucleoside-diphosphate-sugar epimerase
MERSSFWSNRKCLVTGGMGFGGSHLCEQLLLLGATVYVLDMVKPANSYLALSGLADRVEFVQGDVRDLGLLKFVLHRFEIETVFHLAAQPILPMSNALPLETLSINALGTFTVLESVRTSAFAPSLIFASSGAYYGTTMQPERIKEEQAAGKAGNLYGPSKVAGDIALRSYVQTFGIKAAACRFMNTYGPGSTNFSTIVPKTISLLIEGQPFNFGNRDDGSTCFDYMHIQDMTRGYLAVAENIEHVKGEAFNFSGCNGIAVRDLVKLISRLFDGVEREPVFSGPHREVPLQKYLDCSKAQSVLGWHPETLLASGLKDTIEWYKLNWRRLRKAENGNFSAAESLVKA